MSEEHIEETAAPISAAELVADDTDRPVADATFPTLRPDDPENGDEEQTQNPQVAASEPKKRGRKPLPPEEKERRAKLRAEAKAAGKAPPDFSDINGKPAAIPVATAIAQQPTRNYVAEAMQIFVPISMTAAKFLGPHWGVEFDHEKKEIKLTPEQMAYVQSMASWMEFEQFGKLNPRYAFAFHSFAYWVPKTQIDPTPSVIKKWITKVRGMFKRGKKIIADKDAGPETEN